MPRTGKDKKLPPGISAEDGRYRVRLHVDGKQHGLGMYDTLTDAKAVLAIARGEKARGTFVAPAEKRRKQREEAEREKTEAITVASLAEQWLANLAAEGRAASTIVTHRSTLRVHVLPVLGDMQVARVTPALIHGLLSDIPNAIPRRNAGRTLQTLLNFAARPREKGGVIDTSPFQSRIEKPKTSMSRIDRHKIASKAEIEALTAAMPADLALAVPLAAWQALRLGEVLGLQRSDFTHLGEPERAEVRIQRQVSPKANAITPPKWESYRDLAVSAHVLPLLLDHLDRHVQHGPDAPLFPGRGIGGRVSQSQLDRVWRAAREQIKPGFRFHDLRHSGLTHYAQQSATLAELLHRGGHTDVSVALRYQTATAERDRSLTARMDAELDREASGT